MDQREVFPALIEDLKARDQVGWEHYGRPLLTNNGRDALLDLYEEQLDALAYLKQLRMTIDEWDVIGGCGEIPLCVLRGQPCVEHSEG